MTFGPGVSLGPYKIVAVLGAGGMGEVYRARDPRLERDVAVKVLRKELATNAEHLRRFELEARAAAAANHPNIVAVHDVGSADGTTYIVSELLDGENLRETVTRGALPPRKAIGYAGQIASGLVAAHAKGIVHRDLKPENVFVTRDGRIKILDFGLSKLLPAHGALKADGTTVLGPDATAQGVLLGTVGYMAPEQVRGHTSDERTDIFAFGAILHEMFLGQRAFRGASPMETMHAILHDEPAGIANSPPMSSSLLRIIRRCLEKEAAHRFQTASDLSFAIEGLSDESQLTRREPNLALHATKNVWKGVAIVLALFALGLWAALFVARDNESEPQVTRLSMAVPGGAGFNIGFSLSPDGRRLVFSRPGQLWIRSLDSVGAKPLIGTEGGAWPFWSPDNQFVGFFSNGKLRFVSATGGAAQTLGDTSFKGTGFAGGTWNRDGLIVFAGGVGPLQRVSRYSGQVRNATELDSTRQETAHSFPFFLPDGRHFLYVVESRASEHSGLYVGSIDSRAPKRLLGITSLAMYAEPGYLLYARDATLTAQAFDLEALELRGEPFAIGESLGRIMRYAAFSVSRDHTLVYAGEDTVPLRELTWLNRQGLRISALRPPAPYFAPAISPDGTTLAVDRSDAQKGGDIWLFDLARNVSMPLASHPGNDCCPLWMPDGLHVVFGAQSGASYEIRRKSTTGGEEEVLYTAEEAALDPESVSPDAQLITLIKVSPKTNSDIWILPLVGERKAIPFLHTEANEWSPRISPNGRWLAYTSTESGAPDVYVQPFPRPGRKWRVSTHGGFDPVWSRDGKELFYLSPDYTLIAVPVMADVSFGVIGIPAPLFRANIRPLYPGDRSYVVAPDGKRFLVNSALDAGEVPSVTVVLNWAAAPKR